MNDDALIRPRIPLNAGLVAALQERGISVETITGQQIADLLVEGLTHQNTPQPSPENTLEFSTIQSLMEQSVDEISEDIQNLKINQKFEALNQRFDQLETRAQTHETTLTQMWDSMHHFSAVVQLLIKNSGSGAARLMTFMEERRVLLKDGPRDLWETFKDPITKEVTQDQRQDIAVVVTDEERINGRDKPTDHGHIR